MTISRMSSEVVELAMSKRRPPAIHHSTSMPLRFHGRRAELRLLDKALFGDGPSVVAMVGPGGQGKTAIVQHWLQSLSARSDGIDALFLWSFYRGKDSDLCLREMLAYAEGLNHPPEVSASYCVDRLLKIVPNERWALVLDGTEVVQHEQGAWQGRFVHPELGRLLEELGAQATPGVVALTSRFPLPTLEQRRFVRLLSLSTLDDMSAVGLLHDLGVTGSVDEVLQAAHAAGGHAKAVELLGAYLARFHAGRAVACDTLPNVERGDASDEEWHVARVAAAFHRDLPQELQDLVALATSFRQPPTEARFLEYLRSEPLRHLLHKSWQRIYRPLQDRDDAELRALLQALIELRLLERVSVPLAPTEERTVLDAHPLVRSSFEQRLGPVGQQRTAQARAGFLRGRPDRRPPQSLEEAREEVELFHAYADAGLWNEADRTFVALDNPKHRFLAPAFERDLLLRFFPGSDWRQPPLWPGFGRWRSLAICHEMLGQYDDAIHLYRADDAPLRGDALLALGDLQPLLDRPRVAQQWQPLWQAYRAHALCMAGRPDEALRAALTCMPSDIYEWVHVFECLLRLGRLDEIDLASLLYRPPFSDEPRWTELARQRLRADYLRVQGDASDLGREYRALIGAYDQAGLPWERVLTRLSYGRWLLAQSQRAEAVAVAAAAEEIAQRHSMKLLAQDARSLLGGPGIGRP